MSQELNIVGGLGRGRADVGASREAARLGRLWRVAGVLGLVLAWLVYRWASGHPFDPLTLSLPHVDPLIVAPVLFFVAMIGLLLGSTLGAGRSPHVLYRPEQIGVTLEDVKGIEPIKEDVLRSLNLFLAHKEFAAEMGGTPRRGLLFEGPPGTGKTYLAKAMAHEAGVPFLYVSATSFQSMYYGATARKIRSYFKALRKAARQEGGAIGFIEEIDAIATSRGGMAHATPSVLRACASLIGLPAGNVTLPMVSEGTGAVVNELLVQLQSFDEPTGLQRLHGKLIDGVNLFLPAERAVKRPKPQRANLLLIAATNRAASLDPALVRPGRFDRRLTFEPPAKAGRRTLIDHFLAAKAHAPELDDDSARDQLAAATNGYTPIMIEHLFDEALVAALRRGERAMSRADVEQARLIEEVGLGNPTAYTEHESRLIATHEAGHAVLAHLLAPERRLEILTIVKRRDSLGLLAHGDREDVFTQSRGQLLALIQIAMGGLVAEELFFGDVSTGPGGDLLYATNVAAQMVGAAGMTDTLISYQAIQPGAFADTNLVGRVLGDEAGRARVDRLLHEQRDRAREVIEANRHLVEALRDALLDRQELIGDEILKVIESAQHHVVDLRDAELAERL